MTTSKRKGHGKLTPAEHEALYQATRRASLWVGTLMDCPALSQPCRKDLGEWLAAIPESWWARFTVDEGKEVTPCESAN